MIILVGSGKQGELGFWWQEGTNNERAQKSAEEKDAHFPVSLTLLLTSYSCEWVVLSTSGPVNRLYTGQRGMPPLLEKYCKMSDCRSRKPS